MQTQIRLLLQEQTDLGLHSRRSNLIWVCTVCNSFCIFIDGLVKIRVAIYVAQLAKNELLNFELFSQQLFLPKLLGLENFIMVLRFVKPFFNYSMFLHPCLEGYGLYNLPHNIIKIGSNCCNIVSLWCIF